MIKTFCAEALLSLTKYFTSNEVHKITSASFYCIDKWSFLISCTLFIIQINLLFIVNYPTFTKVLKNKRTRLPDRSTFSQIKKKKEKSKSHDIIHKNVGDLNTWIILARGLAASEGKNHLEDREKEMGCKYCEYFNLKALGSFFH